MASPSPFPPIRPLSGASSAYVCAGGGVCTECFMYRVFYVPRPGLSPPGIGPVCVAVTTPGLPSLSFAGSTISTMFFRPACCSGPAYFALISPNPSCFALFTRFVSSIPRVVAYWAAGVWIAPVSLYPLPFLDPWYPFLLLSS